MKLTLEMLLYFIRSLRPFISRGAHETEEYLGVKQFYQEDEELQPEYLYVGRLSEIRGCGACCTFLAVNDLGWEGKELGQKNGYLILVDSSYQVPYLMNFMIDIFNRMSAWDKNMHIAVLEGCDVQTLVDLSESILGHFMVIFDAGFEILAYTKQTESAYQGFRKTIEKGYSEAGIMDKIREKQILKRLRPGEALVAPSAEDDEQLNIYWSFYSDQTLLGYAGLWYDTTVPDPGYIDIFKLFAENMRFCLKRDFENRRYGQMMYETLLVNLIHSERVEQEQLSEQLQYMDGLPERGRFALAAISFDSTENIPMAFLTRMIVRQFWNVRPFLYQNQICLLKLLEPEYGKKAVFSQEELGKLQEILANHRWNMGISSVFTQITDLRYAYLQTAAALRYGFRQQEGPLICTYGDYRFFHLFSAMEELMPVEMLCTEAYLELKKYDAENGTSFLKTVMCYLAHDCNATHTAKALFLHRNTVGNVVDFVGERWGLDLSDLETKKGLVLSELAEQYLSWKNVKYQASRKPMAEAITATGSTTNA